MQISRAGRRALEQNRKVAAAAVRVRLERLDDASRQALAGGLAALRLVLADAHDQPLAGDLRPAKQSAPLKEPV